MISTRWLPDKQIWEARYLLGTNERRKPVYRCFYGKDKKEVLDRANQVLYKNDIQGSDLFGKREKNT